MSFEEGMVWLGWMENRELNTRAPKSEFRIKEAPLVEGCILSTSFAPEDC